MAMAAGIANSDASGYIIRDARARRGAVLCGAELTEGAGEGEVEGPAAAFVSEMAAMVWVIGGEREV